MMFGRLKRAFRVLTAVTTVAAGCLVGVLFFVTRPPNHVVAVTPEGCACIPFDFISPGCCLGQTAATVSAFNDSDETAGYVARDGSDQCDEGVDVRHASELSAREFHHSYVRLRRPVLIKGLADGLTEGLSRWRAMDEWPQDGHLAGIMAAEPHKPTVAVEKKGEESEWEWRHFAAAVKRLEPVYMKQWKFWLAPRGKQELMHDIKRSPGGLFDDNWNLAVHSMASLWYPTVFWGNKGSTTEAHFDIFHTAAWMVTLNGRKHWKLAEKLQPAHTSDETHIPWKRCVQLPGDLMYQPTHCYHAAHNEDTTIGITLNSWNGYNAGYVIPEMWASLQGLPFVDEQPLFAAANRVGLLRWLFLRLVVGALTSPLVSNSDSFQYFATEHAGLYQALLQEAKQLDMQLASFAMIMLSLGLLVIYTMKSEKKIHTSGTEDTAAKPTWRICGL